MLRKLAIGSLLLLIVTIAAIACAQAPSPTPTSVPTKVPDAPKAAATATAAPAAPKTTAAPEPTQPAPSPTIAATKPTAVPATVRLGSLGNLTDAPMMIANAKGYFKSAGLDVQTTGFDSAVQMIPPLGTGQLDIGAGAVSVGKMSVFGIDGDGYVHVQSLWYDQDYFMSTVQLQSKLDFAKVVDNQYVDNAVRILASISEDGYVRQLLFRPSAVDGRAG